jgi:hypothetical protein
MGQVLEFRKKPKSPLTFSPEQLETILLEADKMIGIPDLETRGVIICNKTFAVPFKEVYPGGKNINVDGFLFSFTKRFNYHEMVTMARLDCHPIVPNGFYPFEAVPEDSSTIVAVSFDVRSKRRFKNAVPLKVSARLPTCLGYSLRKATVTPIQYLSKGGNGNIPLPVRKTGELYAQLASSAHLEERVLAYAIRALPNVIKNSLKYEGKQVVNK